MKCKNCRFEKKCRSYFTLIDYWSTEDICYRDIIGCHAHPSELIHGDRMSLDEIREKYSPYC